MARALVLVDARNVIRSRWPNLEEDRFVELARAWAEHEHVDVVLVFDARAPGGTTGRRTLDERTSLVGTGPESADDWIAREAPRLAGEGRQPWLVSSDRDLRARVERYVERMIGGGSFVSLLEPVEREV